jgi:hypothetical protein
MGKINKYANIYDTEGNLIRHVGDDGKLKNYTISELEELVDKLAEEKDENGNVKDPQALNNVYSLLSEQYRKNPQYLFNKMSELQKQRAEGEYTMAEKTAPEEVEKALTEMKTLSEDEKEALYTDMKSFDKEELVDRETNYEPDTYVSYEEVA